MSVFDPFHVAMLAMNSHQATTMHVYPKVRFESFEVEDLSYYILGLASMNFRDPGWLGIVLHPKHYSEAQMSVVTAATTSSNQANRQAESD
jgi:hypothetical protein